MKPTEEKTSEVKTTTEEINNETTDVKVEPSEDSVVNLNASEIQKLKLLLKINDDSVDKVSSKRFSGNGGFILPQMPITEEDLDKFADTLMEGVPYSESYVKYKGKLKLTIKVRSRKDEEEILAQMNEDFKSGMIHSDIAYYARMNLYNLTKQVVSIDNISQVYDSSKTLRENAETGVFGDMPEPKLYILIGILDQFENKVVAMARKALAPDFSGPAIDT